MASAKKTEIFNHSAQDIFNVLADFDKYAEFLPEVKGSKVLKDSGNKKTVELSVSLIKDFKYSIIASLEEPKKITWVFNEGEIFKTNNGSWTLKEISKDKTEVTYELEASFKLFVPGTIAKKLISVSLPKMLEAYKKRIAEVS